jgi:integrase
MNQRRKGPKPIYLTYGSKVCSVMTPTGETGILYDKTANTYFYLLTDDSGTRKKHNLSRDKDKAVIRFYQEVTEQKTEPLVTLEKPNQYDHFNRPYDIEAGPLTGTVPVEVVEASYWERVKKDLLERPTIVSQKTGIEAVARLPELLYSKPTTLGYLYKEYVNKTDKPLDKKYLCDVRYMWQQFLEGTGLTEQSTVEQINRKTVNQYHDYLLAEKRKLKWSTTWMNHRVVFIKSFLKFNKKRIDDNAGIIKSLEIVNDILTQKKQESMDPHPISIKDFWQLYNTANDQWKLILLLGLNTGSYFKDIFDMNIPNFDLKKGTLVMERTKTHLPKCAMLWPETLRLLKQHLKNRKDNLPYLFISTHGNRYEVSSMMGYFRKVLRPASGISEDVTFNNLRDGVKTASEIMKCRPEDISIVLGWKRQGVEDHYLKRNPQMTQDCLDKVREYFKVSEYII